MDDTMQNSGAVSPELDEMVGRLLDNMLGALAAGEDPGVAIVIEDASAHAYEALFCDDGAEQCLEAATAFVAEHTGGIPDENVARVERYAIAYAGCVQLDGVYEDAVLVSFCERSMPCGYSAFVAFRGMGQGDDFMWSDPEPAGEEPSLF